MNFEPIASIFREMASANRPDPGQSEVSSRKWEMEARQAPENFDSLAPARFNLPGLLIYVARIPAAPLKLARCPHSLAAPSRLYVDHSHGPMLAPAT